MGQIVHWVSTGKVAAHKIVHVGIPQARAIVRNKAGKKTEFGVAYLISRLGGGYVFGERIEAHADERQMPLQALSGYRAILGQEATPELVVYDRGGDSTPTRQKLALAGVKHVVSEGQHWGFSPRASGRGRLPRQSGTRFAASVGRPKE